MKNSASGFAAKAANMMCADAERLTGYHVGGIVLGEKKCVPVAIEEAAACRR